MRGGVLCVDVKAMRDLRGIGVRTRLIASDPEDLSLKMLICLYFGRNRSRILCGVLGGDCLFDYSVRDPGEPAGAIDRNACFPHFAQGGVPSFCVEGLELGHIVTAG